MANLPYPDGTFVVITTGREAKTFRVAGGALEQDSHWAPKDLIDDGPAGKIPPDMSAGEIDEATFSKQVAERLYAMAHKGAFDGLILVADPGTLGEIRPLLHQEVSSRILLEQAKTLINSPTEDIERSLASG